MLNWLKNTAFQTQELFFFSWRMIGALFSRKMYLSDTADQMYSLGIGSIYMIALTGILAGQAFTLAMAQEMADFGAKDYLGKVVAISIIRELGPMLTGLMMAARAATGITAEIGAMRTSNQIDAMIAFGIDPMKKIAGPRLVALIVVIPALTVLCDSIAIFGGWVIAKFVAHVSSTIYWASVRERLMFGNLFIGLVKPLAFSLVIAFISCYKGFTAKGGTKGVGKATMESVVLTAITILVVNFFITKLLGSWLKGYL